MEASSKRNTPRLPVEITYTAYNFEHCKHSIIEYTKDLIIQNRVKGIDISRRAVNVAFEANVKDLYVKGSAMRQELLQQIRCPAISYYWEKQSNPAAFLVYMQNETTPYGVVPRSSDDITRNITALVEYDMRIEIPYLGLRNLRQLHYLDIGSKVRVPYFGEDAGIALKPMMAHVWKTVVRQIFWFEDSKLKEEKLAEAYSDEVRSYWKLIEYADFVKSNPSTRDVAWSGSAQSIETDTEKAHLASVAANPPPQFPPNMKPVKSNPATLVAASRQPTAQKVLGYFPSMAAHTAHAKPYPNRDDGEILRLRRAIKEYKNEIRDLSTRLVKAKQVEAQNSAHTARDAGERPSSHIEAPQGQKPDLIATVQPQAHPGNRPSVPTMHNLTLKPTHMVPQITDSLDFRILPIPLPQQEPRSQEWETWSEENNINAFNAQFVQVEKSKERQRLD